MCDEIVLAMDLARNVVSSSQLIADALWQLGRLHRMARTPMCRPVNMTTVVCSGWQPHSPKARAFLGSFELLVGRRALSAINGYSYHEIKLQYPVVQIDVRVSPKQRP